jgi:hypothetical protein
MKWAVHKDVGRDRESDVLVWLLRRVAQGVEVNGAGVTSLELERSGAGHGLRLRISVEDERPE